MFDMLEFLKYTRRGIFRLQNISTVKMRVVIKADDPKWKVYIEVF